MKLSRILFLLGLAANAITLISYFWVIRQPNTSGAGMIYVLFIFPGIWIIFLAIAVGLVMSLRNKSGPDTTGLRIVAFLFCTPIPILCVAFGKYLTEESGPFLALRWSIKANLCTNRKPGSDMRVRHLFNSTSKLTPQH